MAQRAKQVDTTAAEAYDQFMVPTMFAPWIDDVMSLARLVPGEHVLDVACGTGTAARLAAQHGKIRQEIAGLECIVTRLTLRQAGDRVQSGEKWGLKFLHPYPGNAMFADGFRLSPGLRFF